MKDSWNRLLNYTDFGVKLIKYLFTHKCDVVMYIVAYTVVQVVSV